MTTRVWFENGSIQMDGVGAIPAGALTATISGTRIVVATLASYPVAQLEYGEYADKNGNTFTTPALTKVYLDTQFSMDVTGQPGKDGATWTVGMGTPNFTANPNDLYLDTATGDIFRNN